MRENSPLEDFSWKVGIISERLMFNGLFYRNGFDSDYLLVWNDLMRVIVNNILLYRNYKLLEDKLSEVIFSWSIFYKKLSREDRITTRAMLSPAVKINRKILLIMKELVHQRS